MCIAWKFRQRKLHIDDFGNPLDESSPYWSHAHSEGQGTVQVHPHSSETLEEDIVPGLVTTPSEDPIAVRVVLAAALESAVESSLMSPGLGGPQMEANEQTPLLRRSDTLTEGSYSARSSSDSKNLGEAKGWQAWFGR